MWNNELNQELTNFEKHLFEKVGSIIRRLHDMAIDLTGLKAAQAKVAADVTALVALAQTAIANQNDPTLQGQLDAITAGLTTSTTAAEAELASVASATGVTGATGPTA